MKRSSLSDWTPSSPIISTPAMGIERGVLSAGSASDSIITEQSVMSVPTLTTVHAPNYTATTKTSQRLVTSNGPAVHIILYTVSQPSHFPHDHGRLQRRRWWRRRKLRWRRQERRQQRGRPTREQSTRFAIKSSGCWNSPRQAAPGLQAGPTSHNTVEVNRYITWGGGARHCPVVSAGGRCMYPVNQAPVKGQNPWNPSIYI